MSRPELVIPVADLDRGPKQVQFVLSEAWLRRALEGSDASITAAGSVDVTFTKNGTSILVRGKLTADLTMPCVVTLDPVPIPVRTEIVLLLEPKSGASNEHEEHVARRRARPVAVETPAKPDKPDKKSAERPGRTKTLDKSEGHWGETPVLDEETAGQDTYEGHEVALDGFVREFLILELPMFPRRSDLPTDGAAANPPLPADSQPGGDKPLDPRLSPLAELKSRLEQKIKKE
jgi:uncharacterized metal-binding protein YceD (DUF177 family)